MVEQLRLVFVELKAVPIREAVYFRETGSLFDSQGNLLDESILAQIDRFLDELSWYARVLKAGREST